MITPRQYAAALLDALDATPATNMNTVIARFVAVLKRDRMLARANRIVREVHEQWNRRNGAVDVSVRGAFPFTKKTLEGIGDSVKVAIGAKQATVSGTEETALLGGAIIQYGDTRADGSVKRKLQLLMTSITK